MSQIALSRADGAYRILIRGRFTLASNPEVRAAYQRVPTNQPITVDLSDTDYLDSAGLGMLVRLREHAGSGKSAITLTGVKPAIRTVLDIAHFDRLFTIV